MINVKHAPNQPVGADDGYDATAMLVAALSRQRQAQVIETHISWVLLDGHQAWKIKKPVHLPFLDTTELATREWMCHEEVRLNRRLAPSLYLGVASIHGTVVEPHIEGAGAAIEYAVWMRQFPADALLSDCLAAGRLRPVHLDRFAHRLAVFHRQARVAGLNASYGSPEAIARATHDVIANLASFDCAPQCEVLLYWLDAQTPLLHDTWLRRKIQGRVIEGHGDLHLANALMLDDEVTAFDCIEFDPALRWIDALSDVAFLMMDLLAHGRADLAFRFFNAYLDESGDHDGVPVLRHYLVYRALVRAWVARLKAGPGQAVLGPDYLGLAMRLMTPAEASLTITHGLSGSGKTVASQHRLEQQQAVRLRSDVIRKRLFDLDVDAASQTLGAPSIYNPADTARTYARLYELAQMCIKAGWPVIVDATFLARADRQRFHTLAEQAQVPFRILHCEAPLDVLRQRIAQRLLHGHDASEADLAVLDQQRAHAEPLSADELQHLV